MQPFLYKFFHEQTNDRTEGGFVNIPENREDWPEAWKITEYKRYDRSEKKDLPEINSDSKLYSIIEKRNSNVSKISSQEISLGDISYLLKSAYGLVGNSGKRSVPSGGARFPLEVYVSVWGCVADLVPGNYHYNIEKHRLDILPSNTITKDETIDFTGYKWVKDTHGAFLISSVFNRSTDKYGSRGYRYILLEAGHVGQNLCLAAAELDLSVRPMGGFNEEYFEKLLSLDFDNERIVYVITF